MGMQLACTLSVSWDGLRVLLTLLVGTPAGYCRLKTEIAKTNRHYEKALMLAREMLFHIKLQLQNANELLYMNWALLISEQVRTFMSESNDQLQFCTHSKISRNISNVNLHQLNLSFQKHKLNVFQISLFKLKFTTFQYFVRLQRFIRVLEISWTAE